MIVILVNNYLSCHVIVAVFEQNPVLVGRVVLESYQYVEGLVCFDTVKQFI
jgi:hypothetical protein